MEKGDRGFWTLQLDAERARTLKPEIGEDAIVEIEVVLSCWICMPQWSL